MSAQKKLKLCNDDKRANRQERNCNELKVLARKLKAIIIILYEFFSCAHRLRLSCSFHCLYHIIIILNVYGLLLWHFPQIASYFSNTFLHSCEIWNEFSYSLLFSSSPFSRDFSTWLIQSSNAIWFSLYTLIRHWELHTFKLKNSSPATLRKEQSKRRRRK
jgi:hypothetical protein